MAGSSGGELRAPVFNGENYDFWSIRMKTIFKSHGLWDLVIKGFDSTDLKKSDESNAKKKEKEESSDIGKDTFAMVLMKDAKALGLIQGAISDEVFPRISHEETSKGAWNILQQEYHGDKQVRSVKLQSLRREFEYTRMKDDESLTAYITKLFDLINQMRSYEEQLPRERVVQKLLISLPSAYDSICSVIEHSRDLNVIEVQKVVASLKSFELRLTDILKTKLRRHLLVSVWMPNQLKLVIKILRKIRVGKQKARSGISKQMMVLKILASTVANYILESVDSRANQSVSTVTNLGT
ncbi:hypothetical protein L3X38_024546 [Prunus dulcis]|uniref:DUF4219 domain-containing protein n=1 Tax=Prunus dulcis TaxID=3755 RepID=A0AAD4W045_PRUDU|nr:hypothetical protein L3X38_024546 [Prunus dulcis]